MGSLAEHYAPLLEKLQSEQQPVAIPEGGELVGGIIFESIRDFLENGIPDPEFLVDDVLYDGEHLHLISGHPGEGKTSWVMQLAWLVMAQGRDVVWFDYEGGKGPTVRRLLDVGVPKALLLERFHYAGWPANAEKYLEAVADKWHRPLVVMDSLSKALSFAGIDEDKPSQVTSWITPVVKTCKQREMPLIIIDHVKKDSKDSQYSRGAGSKLADVDVHWGVKVEQKFNRTQSGSISVKQHKDRPGYFPFATWWKMGDGQGHLTVTPMDGPPDPEDADAPSI